MAQTPEQKAYKALVRALQAMVEVEGLAPGTVAEQLAGVMDAWCKKFPGTK